jgi:hypothetical protein
MIWVLVLWSYGSEPILSTRYPTQAACERAIERSYEEDEKELEKDEELRQALKGVPATEMKCVEITTLPIGR